MSEIIGPTVWHGREILSCTRCKYLKCTLTKSGRHPDYDYYCKHPDVLSDTWHEAQDKVLLEKVKTLHPESLEHVKNNVEIHRNQVKQYGEFISNDEVTPETPQWCPVLNQQSKS